MASQPNPLASPVYSGLNPAAPPNYVDADWSLPYNFSLTANQNVPDGAQNVDEDADFILTGIVSENATGAFNIRISDSQGYDISQGYIASANLIGDPSSPFVVWPPLIIPAAGRIGIDITDTSGNSNSGQILFRGFKRYRKA